MARGDGVPVEREEPTLTIGEIATMLKGLIRHKTLLQDALRLGLDSPMFNGAGEVSFYYLFTAMKNLFMAHAALTEEMLTTELTAWHQSGHMAVSQEDWEFLFGDGKEPGLISVSFNSPKLEPKEETAERAYIEAILRRFMNSRLIKQQIQSAISLGGEHSGAPAGLEAKLSRWAKTAQAVQFIGRELENAAHAPKFGTLIELPPPPVPTSLPWVDKYLGGFRPGEILGLLAPFGGGKTTLMATAAVRMAQNFAARGQNKLSVYVCYEDEAKKMRPLFYSAAAHIERKVFINNPNFWDQLSTRGNPKHYDRELPENRNGKIIIGEAERWNAMEPWFNKHFFLLDFSANSENAGFGSGGVAEILSVLTRLAEARHMEIGFVAVDYAGLLVNRELAIDTSTKNKDQIWRPMQQVPDNIRTNIAVPFAATVMLAHQLAGGDIKNIPPHRYVTHLDAQGSKAFAENLHACMCINERDKVSNVSTINWSKIRSGLPVTPYGLIKMDEHIVDIHLVNDDYICDEGSRAIVKKGQSGFVTPAMAGAAAEPITKAARKVGKIDNFAADMM